MRRTEWHTVRHTLTRYLLYKMDQVDSVVKFKRKMFKLCGTKPILLILLTNNFIAANSFVFAVFMTGSWKGIGNTPMVKNKQN